MTIEDNQHQKPLAEMGCSQQDVDNLMKIANVSVSELQKKHPSLLVFPDSWNEYHDGVGGGTICEIREGAISTGNIMGFVGINDTRLSITSRFTPGENGRNDYFLHYMLQKVLSLNVLDLKHSTDDDSGFDFLIYLFPHFLQRALRQGVFRTYIRREYNDSRVKGPIDFARHIKNNIPFNGKIAYTTREYNCDNDITQLIRHTIEHIRQHRLAGSILTSSKEIREAVTAIQMLTPSYSRQQRQRIIAANLQPLQHPYFSEYQPLQRLCLAILRRNELKYGYQKDEIHGILFDGAWLWEEYLNTVLSKVGFNHPRNKEQSGRKHLFVDNEKHHCYPDFLRGETVIDAKYKQMEEENEQNGKIKEKKIDRNDLFQIISYLHILNAKETGIVYPSQQQECKKSPVGTLNGMGGKVFTIPFPIPQKAESMDAFIRGIAMSESELARECVQQQ